MTENVKRERKVTGLGHSSDGSALGLALTILLALGIKNTVDLNTCLHGGDFGEVSDDAPLNPIETTIGYPDRVAVLEDGTVLICDATDGNDGMAIGSVYSDEVLAQPDAVSADAKRPEEQAQAEAEAVDAEPLPPVPTIS